MSNRKLFNYQNYFLITVFEVKELPKKQKVFITVSR